MAITDKQLQDILETTGHSAFGPSSMPRIVACPGSVNESLKAPIPESSSFAAHGTLLHAAIEEILNQKYNDGPEPTIYPTLDIPDAAFVLDALGYAEKIIAEHDNPTIIIEGPVSMASWGIPEVTGTADLIVISATRADICDWKFGSGIARYAFYPDTGKGDEQGLCYAAGSLGFDGEHPNIDVFIHICQPPLKIESVWPLTYNEMARLVDTDIIPAVTIARSEDPPCNPGIKQCRFCGANMLCESRHNAVKTDAAKVFNAISATVVSDEAISKLLSKAEHIAQYVTDANKYVLKEIMAGKGDRFPDWKAVRRGTKRKIIDPEGCLEYLRGAGIPDDNILKPETLKPMGQLESLVKKVNKEDGSELDISGFIHKPEGGLALAPITDGRPAVAVDVASVFNETD